MTKSPSVTVDGRDVKYLISFTLPRFCDQSLGRSRKERFYRRATDAWVAKLDTVIHELYHIDPEQKGIRRIEREDGTCSRAQPWTAVSREGCGDGVGISRYVAATRRPTIFSSTISTRSKRCTAVSPARASGRFPSYPQRFQERLAEQPPCSAELVGGRCRTVAGADAARDLHRRRSSRAAVSPRVVAQGRPSRSARFEPRKRVAYGFSDSTRRPPTNRGAQ